MGRRKENCLRCDRSPCVCAAAYQAAEEARQRRASGPTQPESARVRKQLLLRLDPSTIATLRCLARERGQTMGDVVTAALTALQRTK